MEVKSEKSPLCFLTIIKSSFASYLLLLRVRRRLSFANISASYEKKYGCITNIRKWKANIFNNRFILVSFFFHKEERFKNGDVIEKRWLATIIYIFYSYNYMKYKSIHCTYNQEIKLKNAMQFAVKYEIQIIWCKLYKLSS